MDQVHRGSPWTRGQRNVDTPAAYVYAHEQLRLCFYDPFYVSVRYFVVLDSHL